MSYINSPNELLSDPQKGTTRAQGILCYLFRHVLLWRRVGIFEWNKRARIYFEKPHNRDRPDKGNLNKALVADDFTWPTFKRAVDFLNPQSAVLVVQLTWKSGRVSKYPIIIDPAEDEADAPVNTFGDDDYSDVFDTKKKPANTLARLFRRIVTEEKIGVTRWNALFDAYVSNPLHGIPQNRKDKNSTIKTLQRDLLQPRMTWNSFRKGILVLNPEQEDYILELRWSKKRDDSSTHLVTIRDPLSIKPKPRSKAKPKPK